MKSISIIGLGWIGLPLAEKLASEGYEVIGSTRKEEKASQLNRKGFSVVSFHLNPHPSGTGFNTLFQSDTLVIGFPPKSRSQSSEFYLQQVSFLKKLIDHSKVKKVLFISSTGIYPQEATKSEYDEEEALNKNNCGNDALLEAERIISEKRSYQLSIIRFGGLMGADRILGKYLEGKENVDGTSQVNYIHQVDAVNLCHWVIEENLWEEIFNGVAPIHPTKKEILIKNSSDFGFEMPKSFAPKSEKAQRIISGEKVLDMGFEFKFPDPLSFSYEI